MNEASLVNCYLVFTQVAGAQSQTTISRNWTILAGKQQIPLLGSKFCRPWKTVVPIDDDDDEFICCMGRTAAKYKACRPVA